jgi:hypothetical protein
MRPRAHGAIFGVTVAVGGLPYADTLVVCELAGGTVAEAVADVVAEGVGVAASSAWTGGPPYIVSCGWGCAQAALAVASAKSAARDERPIDDTLASAARAPQNGHASLART